MTAAITSEATRAEEPGPGKQVEQKLEFEDGTSIGYWLYLPKNYEAKPMPLMLFLHGRGESNGPLAVVKKWGPPRWVELGQDFPFIIVSPQCPREVWWHDASEQKKLLGLLEHIKARLQVNADQVYLTGLSMGGYGTWRLAADHPELFAAAAPICGAGKTEDANQLVDVPIWAFHGVDDSVVPYEKSKEMVDAIKKAGGTKVRLTSLEGIDHNSWSAAYASPSLYGWLLSHKLSDRAASDEAANE